LWAYLSPEISAKNCPIRIDCSWRRMLDCKANWRKSIESGHRQFHQSIIFQMWNRFQFNGPTNANDRKQRIVKIIQTLILIKLVANFLRKNYRMILQISTAKTTHQIWSPLSCVARNQWSIWKKLQFHLRHKFQIEKSTGNCHQPIILWNLRPVNSLV